MRRLYRSAASVLSILLFLGTAPAASAETGRSDTPRRVVGYLPDWSYQYYTKVDFSALTHLNIAFCNPDENSNISCNIPDDTLQTIIDTAHAHNVKVMPSVATTVSSITFASLIDTPEEITRLNDNLIAYCQKFGFDGIDLDVERGSTDAVWNYYGSKRYPEKVPIYLADVFQSDDFLRNQERLGIDFADPEIAKIAFSDMDIKQKRIAIKKLGMKGLDPKFVKMFMKLYDYLADI